MKTAREVLICVVLVIGGAALFQLALLFQSSRAAVDGTTKTMAGFDLMRISLQAQLTGKYGLLSEATAAARESRKTIDVVQATSLAERAKVVAFSDASIHAMNDLDGVVREAETTVHGLQATNEKLGVATVALQSDIESAKPVLDGATTLLATLNSGTGGSLTQLQTIEGHVDDLVTGAKPIEASLTATAASGAHGTSELDKIATDAAAYFHELLHPEKKGFWRDLATSLLGPAARVILDHLWVERVKVAH